MMKDIAELFGALLLRFLFVSPFFVLFWWLRRSAKNLQPREGGGSLEFRLAPQMQILIWVVIGSLVTFSGLVAIETVRKREGLWAASIPLAVLGAILVAKPKTVSINHEGIHQHRLFGVDRVIAWNEIAWIRRGPRTGATYVKSRNGGRPISFSPLLVGQQRFEHELKSRLGYGKQMSSRSPVIGYPLRSRDSHPRL